jgi:hypothetical protein
MCFGKRNRGFDALAGAGFISGSILGDDKLDEKFLTQRTQRSQRSGASAGETAPLRVREAFLPERAAELPVVPCGGEQGASEEDGECST